MSGAQTNHINYIRVCPISILSTYTGPLSMTAHARFTARCAVIAATWGCLWEQQRSCFSGSTVWDAARCEPQPHIAFPGRSGLRLRSPAGKPLPAAAAEGAVCRAAQPSQFLPATAHWSLNDRSLFRRRATPGPARPLRQPGHGELRQHGRARRSARRPCPHPAGDCGHPGALPAPAPDPRALTRTARGQAGPQPPFPVHQHHPRRRPAPRACARPFGASCPHLTWPSSHIPPRGARGSRVPPPGETRLAPRAGAGPPRASGPMRSCSAVLWSTRLVRMVASRSARWASHGGMREIGHEGQRADREWLSQKLGVLRCGWTWSAGHRLRDAGPCGVSPWGGPACGPLGIYLHNLTCTSDFSVITSRGVVLPLWQRLYKGFGIEKTS